MTAKVGSILNFLTGGAEAEKEMPKEKKDAKKQEEEEDEEFEVEKLLDMEWRGKKQFFLVRGAAPRVLIAHETAELVFHQRGRKTPPLPQPCNYLQSASPLDGH